MDKDDHYEITQERTKTLTKIGFFFGIVIIGPLVILLMIWFSFHTFFPNETELMVSHSHTIKIKLRSLGKRTFQILPCTFIMIMNAS